MIGAFHLLWIIPVSACFGFFFGVILSASKDREDY